MCGSGSVFGIRIRKAPEYGSNTDPDPQHWLQFRNRNSSQPSYVSSNRHSFSKVSCCTVINVATIINLSFCGKNKIVNTVLHQCMCMFQKRLDNVGALSTILENKIIYIFGTVKHIAKIKKIWVCGLSGFWSQITGALLEKLKKICKPHIVTTS